MRKGRRGRMKVKGQWFHCNRVLFFNRVTRPVKPLPRMDNRQVENLSEKCRPSNIAVAYNSLESQQWIEAKETLEDNTEYDEETILRILCAILMVGEEAWDGTCGLRPLLLPLHYLILHFNVNPITCHSKEAFLVTKNASMSLSLLSKETRSMPMGYNLGILKDFKTIQLGICSNLQTSDLVCNDYPNHQNENLW